MPEAGFSKIKVIVLVAAVILAIGAGIALTQLQSEEPTNTSATPGSTGAIEKIAGDEADDEAAIDGSYTSQDQDSVDATDTAASKIGDAYNDADL
ncbi:MAG TPA: hypothetical protein VD735_02300 [Candidatus Saccharimonadales bacterium]|nr:hypothetical protein [Candidatus Saccharimonadales bacterium]